MANLPPSPFFSSAAVESAEALPAVVSGKDHDPAGSGPIEPDDISCIGEIFLGARKLNLPPFKLDVEQFMADIEEPPLFLRRRWA